MARRDLVKYTNSKFLGGSVTRCRLKDYTAHDFSIQSNQYRVMDIIMYVATADSVLVFLHYPAILTKESSSKSYLNLCGDNAYNSDNISSNNTFCALTLKEGLIEQEKLLSPLLSASSSLSSVGSVQNEYTDSSPHQSLYILDSRTKSVLLSWPDHYPNELGGVDYYNNNLISSLDDRPMLPGISCSRCVHHSRNDYRGQKIDSLIIEYGSVTFLIACLERKQPAIPPLPKRPYSLPSSPIKYNQLNEYPFRLESEPLNQANICQEQHKKYQLHVSSIPLKNTVSQQYSHNNSQHRCQSCGTESSPEWRRGPTGHKTLCNACGLRYSRSVARQEKIANYRQKQHHLSFFQNQIMPQPPSSFYSNEFGFQ
ncbi:hypothetical protein [Parasitella parasitica]|uniref:GATA-type domain-containing protein n=1 Tax=Parasitella parasitica TaxID=35722 RepID=A0A0B7NPJ5_9FUNG|nr:hypothetical protein [Parasitella parasitica]